MQDIEYAGLRQISGLVIAHGDRHSQLTRPRFEQATITEHDRMRVASPIGQLQAEFRADTCRLATGDGYARAHHFSSSRFST
jgi:hypothetical protein